MVSIKETPTCIACSREQKDVSGMCGVRPAGSRYHLCFDCIDGLKLIADTARAEWEGSPE